MRSRSTNACRGGGCLRCRSLWLIAVGIFLLRGGSWFYYGWFTTWLVRGAGLSVAQMGVFASFPFAMGMVGNLVGGAVTERLRGAAREAQKHIAG